MRLTSIHLGDFRNYAHTVCAFSPGISMITGTNGQGKTNLVEAIYYLSIGKAYRQARDEQLIRWGARSFSIKGNIESRRGTTEVEVRYQKDEKPYKTILRDGLRQRRWEDMSGALTSVLFSPESMSVIKGGPQERRSFLDYDITQISLTYGVDIYRYRRLLAQRNAMLKRLGNSAMPMAQKKEQLSVWDQQLIDYGSRIVEKRLAFVEKMTPMARLTQRRLTEGKENLELRYMHYAQKYVTGDEIGDNGKTKAAVLDRMEIAAYLQVASEHALADDLRFGITQWGPHRDDVRILLDGADLRQFGSQGQQRTGVLALKLAELEVFRGESGEYPILLLDDVLSELDGDRQRQLLSIINEKDIQCVITSTEDRNSDFLDRRQRKRFLIRQGEIHEQLL